MRIKQWAGVLLALALTMATRGGVYAKEREPAMLPILMYHQITASPTDSRYAITTAQFEQDLQALQAHGYTAITIRDLINYVKDGQKLPDKPIMLTFDDGYESDYVYAFPLLQKYRVKAVFNIIGKYTDLYSGDVTKDISYSHLSWSQVKVMHQSGLAEFHNHTYDMHSTDKRRGALKQSNESLSEYEKAVGHDFKILNEKYIDHVGAIPVAFACPFGYFDDSLKQTVKNLGYAAILTSHQRVNWLTGDPEELFSLGRFVRGKDISLAALIKEWASAGIQ